MILEHLPDIATLCNRMFMQRSDADDATHPGAHEVNDGTDNQCPLDAGFGGAAVDLGPTLRAVKDAALGSVLMSWRLSHAGVTYNLRGSMTVAFENPRPNGPW